MSRYDLPSINSALDYLHALAQLKNRYLIVIAAKYTTGSFLSPEIAQALTSLGVEYDLSWQSVGQRNRAFVSVFDEGNKVFESLADDSEPVSFKNNTHGLTLDVVSMSWRHGDRVNVNINDEDFSISSRGLNLVVYDVASSVLIDSVGIDTHSEQLDVKHYHQVFASLRERLELIQAGGYSIPQYCYDVGITDLVVYSEPQYLELLATAYDQFKLYKKVNVRFVSRKSFSKTRIYDSLVGVYSFADINSLDITTKDTVLIFARGIDHTHYLMRLFKEHAGRVMQLEELLKDMASYTFSLRPLLAFKARHPDVAIINYSSFPFPHENLSDNEKQIADENITMGSFFRGLREGRFIVSRTAFEENDCSPEDILIASTTPQQYYDLNGISRLEDQSNKGIVNIVEGHRWTPGQPDDTEFTVFMIGGCKTYGKNSPDNMTIAAYLQALFNRSGKRIKVENYGQFISRRVYDAPIIMAELPCKPGDIVVAETFANIDNERHHIPNYYHFSCKLERPHNYGELFTDVGPHFTPNGNRAIAEQIGGFLVSNDFFRTHDVAISDVKEDTAIPEISSAPILYGINKPVQNERAREGESEKELAEFMAFIKDESIKKLGHIGAIVMNCNPFTLGHRYLIEYAARHVRHLFVFVVEEDKSYFPFKDRIELVKAGVREIENVTVLPSGKFMISSLTFVDYFNKAELQDRVIDPSFDVKLFAGKIAPTLGITVRFAGEEPTDSVTRQYNESMKRILPQYGIEFREIPRAEISGVPISASIVRALLEKGRFEDIAQYVPETTLEYLREKHGSGDDESIDQA
jgi:[citrate (pro-3S)-lyase] ligase